MIAQDSAMIATEEGKTMRKNSALKAGDHVVVRIPQYQDINVSNITPFNGMTTTVTAKIYSSKYNGSMYTLDGAVSEAGKPYFFLAEWLFRIED